MPTEYYNPTTRRWESREELGERPATAETVIASESLLCSNPVAIANIIGDPLLLLGTIPRGPNPFFFFLGF